MKIRMRDGSGVRQYKHVIEDQDRHGNVRLYFRTKGKPKIRLQSVPGTPEFDAEYQQAYRGETKLVSGIRRMATPGSMRWLCEQYFASPSFEKLAPETRKVRRSILDRICSKTGTFRFSDMEPIHVAKLRDEKAQFPQAANAIVKALRHLFKWASSPSYALANKNPAEKVEYFESANPDGLHSWTEDEVLQYENHHPIGSKARLAIGLLLYLGVRRSDVVRLGPQMESDGKLHFVEFKGRTKTPKTHALPILPVLREIIDATPSGHLTYLITAYGRPHSAKAFGNWFKKQCRAAGLEHCSAHGLRKTGATRAAENGATEFQLMAIFGWAALAEASRYTRKANRAKLENDAMHLLSRQNENKNVPLLQGASSGGTSSRKKS